MKNRPGFGARTGLSGFEKSAEKYLVILIIMAVAIRPQRLRFHIPHAAHLAQAAGIP